jgi:hypothetical protein
MIEKALSEVFRHFINLAGGCCAEAFWILTNSATKYYKASESNKYYKILE